MKNMVIIILATCLIITLSSPLLICHYPIDTPLVYAEEFACPDGRVIDTDIMHEYYAAKDFPDEYMKFFCSIPCEEMPYPNPMYDYPGFSIGLSSPSGHCAIDSITFTYIINSQNKLIVLMMYDQEKMQHKLLWISEESPEGLEEYLQKIIDESNKLINTFYDYCDPITPNLPTLDIRVRGGHLLARWPLAVARKIGPGRCSEL